MSRSVRAVVRELGELGSLCRRLRAVSLGKDPFPEQGEVDPTSPPRSPQPPGLIRQAFEHALHEELNAHYRLVAVLEGRIRRVESLAQLSLRRVHLWIQEALQRFRLLEACVEGCRGLKGGNILNIMYAMSRHGDPFIRGFIHRMLDAVSKPFFTMLKEWIYEGELNDPYGEFFITTQDVPDDLMWRQKYILRRSMTPSFIPESLASKIISIGKSLNFLRYTCGDSGWLKENITEHSHLQYGDLPGLEMSIDAAYLATSRRLMDVLRNKFHLLDHLDALKRFLLLCQGDFVQYLMDALGDCLSESASSLFRHNLTSTLETAIRSSNVQYDHVDIQRRLDVRTLETSPGDVGWDVFTLDYRVELPLSTILTQQAM
ncbi:gamma-tubulin complex component protein, partial [Piptocephalis cylindrospora]